MANMVSSMETSTSSIGSVMKMSTSESEQSISEKCASRLSESCSDRSVFLSETISDEDVRCEVREDNGAIRHCQMATGGGDYSDLQSHDSLGSIEEFLADSENHNVSFERSNYFSLTFTNEDIENLTKANVESDDGFEAGVFLNSTVNGVEEGSDVEDNTIVANISDISSKKSSMKLFSPEKVLTAMTRMRGADCDVEEKVSPMDLSSPDSNKSFAEDVTTSLGTCTTSGEAATCVPAMDAKTRADDSLDEISSGEMSSGSGGNLSRISQNVSEFWDEEPYLSEYHYDEQIDEDKERRLLNFGDDYRNFLDSLSESHSSIGGNLMDDKRKRSKRLSKKKLPDSARSYDTCSDNEADDVSSIIADSQRSINSVETRKSNWEEDGFVKEEHFHEYNELVGICSENLKTIIGVLRTKDLQETFVSKKKSREMRFLLNKWERLHNRIKENIAQTGVYGVLRKDVISFQRDLMSLLERTEQPSVPEEGDQLESRLHTFKDAMTELSDFKSHLFELNLSVHNFLAELNSSQINSKPKFEHAVHLKDDVIGLYTLWDRAHHQTAGNIASTEEALKKLKCFESELLGLRDTLRQDAQVLRERGSRRRPGKGKNSSGDSGISDDSQGYFTDGDLPLREEHLSKLRIMAKSLEQNLPASSTPMLMIKHTLKTTSEELKDLQKTYSKIKALNRKPKSIKAVTEQNEKRKTAVMTPQGTTSFEAARRRQVVKMALLMNGLLLLTALLCWMCQPQCCDQANTMAFQPQLRFVNGPPPT